MAITVTITDITKGPFQVASLFSATPPAGVTVTASAAAQTSKAALHIQASLSNGTAIVYSGDANTQSNGSHQGQELAAGAFLVGHSPAEMDEIYLNASANGAKINLDLSD